MSLDYENPDQDPEGRKHILKVFGFVVFLILLVLLAGCGPASPRVPIQTNLTKTFSPTDELEGCTVTKLDASNAPDLYVVRCPNSTTSTHWEISSGKTRHRYNTVVIDNQTYDLVPQEKK